MMSSKKNEKKEKKEEVKLKIRESDRALKTIQAFAKEAEKAQKDMARIVTPSIQRSLRNLATITPSLQASIVAMQAVKSAYQNIADSVLIAERMRATMYDKHFAQAMKRVYEVNLPLLELSKTLKTQGDILRNLESVRVQPIELTPIFTSTRSNMEGRIRALENALARLTEESDKKDEVIEELKRIISELLEKTKKSYIS